MEGMISKDVLNIQSEYVGVGACVLSLDEWAKGLTVRLLEATHGQWMYRNIVVHDLVEGLEATKRKQYLEMEIEHRIELGGEGLVKQDRYLLEINLEDLEKSAGEDQYYWLLAIQAARDDRVLKAREEQAVVENQRRERRMTKSR